MPFVYKDDGWLVLLAAQHSAQNHAELQAQRGPDGYSNVYRAAHTAPTMGAGVDAAVKRVYGKSSNYFPVEAWRWASC